MDSPRPEKIDRGRDVVAEIRAGTYEYGAMSDERAEEFVETLSAAEHVNEADIYLATYYGDQKGRRRPLTKKQARLLQEYARGLSGDQIAMKLKCSRSNVNNITQAARFSLQADSLPQAVAMVVAAGLATVKPIPPYETQGRKPVYNAKLVRRNAGRPSNRTSGVLTDRQMRVLELMADGLSNLEIAEKNGVGEETVKSHVRTIYADLRARNRTHAVAVAYQRGLLSVG